jgi:hypothetical protein
MSKSTQEQIALNNAFVDSHKDIMITNLCECDEPIVTGQNGTISYLDWCKMEAKRFRESKKDATVRRVGNHCCVTRY